MLLFKKRGQAATFPFNPCQMKADRVCMVHRGQTSTIRRYFCFNWWDYIYQKMYQPAWQAQKGKGGKEGKKARKREKGKGAPAVRAGVFVIRQEPIMGS